MIAEDITHLRIWDILSCLLRLKCRLESTFLKFLATRKEGPHEYQSSRGRSIRKDILDRLACDLEQGDMF